MDKQHHGQGRQPIVILFVDVDLNYVESIQRSFRKYDVEIKSAFDGVQAYAALTSYKPDLIITDLRMPAATGNELLQWLRGNKLVCEIPAIIVSGAITDDQTIDFITTGADAVLRKPVSVADLIAEVERLLGPLPATKLSSRGQQLSSTNAKAVNLIPSC